MSEARTPATLPSPVLCPICGEPNECAMEIEKATGEQQPPCWCTRVDFSADLLARVPAEMRNLSCICNRCAMQAAQDAQDAQARG
jgi:hypothetical protein